MTLSGFIITIVPLIMVAILSVLGNIGYFEYQFKKERNKKTSEECLTRLLLPLYFILNSEDLEFDFWMQNGDLDLYEFVADKPERLLKRVGDIIKENLYLADDELHAACVFFIEWAYTGDPKERFQRIHEGELEEDENLIKFKSIVYRKYDEYRKNYLSL